MTKIKKFFKNSNSQNLKNFKISNIQPTTTKNPYFLANYEKKAYFSPPALLARLTYRSGFKMSK